MSLTKIFRDFVTNIKTIISKVIKCFHVLFVSIFIAKEYTNNKMMATDVTLIY